MTVPAVRLNHAVLFVSDLDRAVEFYTHVFDMTVAAREPRANAVFLRLRRGGNHHDLGLFGLGVEPGSRPSGTRARKHRGVGLYHLAWQVDTIDELAQAQRALAEAGALSGMSSHGATKSLYGADPDGNEFEIMWMLPREAWGEHEHSAVVERLDLAGELRRWSGERTAGRIVSDPHVDVAAGTPADA